MQHDGSLRRFLLLALSLLSGCAAADPSTPVDAPPAPAAVRAASAATAAFLTARFAASEHDVDYAAQQYMRALSADPDNVDLRQQAFLAALLAGRPEATQLATNLPENQAAALLSGDSDAKVGRWEQAEARFAAMPRQGLMQVLQPLVVAWAQQGQDKTDQALATLRPFVEAPRLRAIYALHAALIADLAHRSAEAARLFRIAQTEYATTNLQLGRLFASWQAREGFLSDAQATLDSMAEANPDLRIALPGLKAEVAQKQIRTAQDGLAETYLGIAAALRAQDSADFAVVLLRLALDLRPDLSAARLLSAEVLDGQKRPARALAVLDGVPVNDPLSPVVRLRQAALAERTGDSDAALRQLDQLGREYPNRPEPPAMTGDVLRVKRRYAEAVTAYDKAVALLGTPTRVNWPLFYDRGMALERSHQWARAEADFLKALELSPDQPFVMNYLGYSWTEQSRNLPRARQMIERAVQQRPNDGAVIDSLGWVVLRQGDVPGAVKYLERAVELEPEDPSINGHLGDAYWAAGRRLEAAFQWRRALNLNPDPDDATKLQAKLRDSETALRGAGPTTAEKTTRPAIDKAVQ